MARCTSIPPTTLTSSATARWQADNLILVAINLDPTQEQAGWIDLDLKHLAIPHDQTFEVEDLLTGAHYQWHDRSNYVALRPDVMPAHIFRITREPGKTETVLNSPQHLHRRRSSE